MRLETGQVNGEDTVDTDTTGAARGSLYVDRGHLSQSPWSR